MYTYIYIYIYIVIVEKIKLLFHNLQFHVSFTQSSGEI